ncbi:Sortase family protein [Aurantimicrobium sp. MWH-Uga1]|nr:Sortase family protein [Aurantimicrobium sp. MWH-Uga1]
MFRSLPNSATPQEHLGDPGKVGRVFKPATLSRVMGIVGELLITFGVIVLLFLAWQLWINNAVVANQQQAASQELSKEWATDKDKTASAPANEDFGPAPAFGGVAEGAKFATLYIPRLGPDSTRVVANGIDLSTILDKGYYGHYPDTQWPGQPGNFAVAVHRTGNGSPFADAPQLQPGDKIYVETQEGFYTYAVRNYEYVLPIGVDVLLPVPGSNNPSNGQSIITITTCNPLLGDAERMIVYGVLESWRPQSAGPPPAMVKSQSGVS